MDVPNHDEEFRRSVDAHTQDYLESLIQAYREELMNRLGMGVPFTGRIDGPGCQFLTTEELDAILPPQRELVWTDEDKAFLKVWRIQP